MHGIRRLLAAASVVALSGGFGVLSVVPAGAVTAPAMPPRLTTATAHVHIYHAPVMGGGGQWATANIKRTVTVNRVATLRHHVFKYTAVVTDTGTFVTINRAPTPNQYGRFAGMHIRGAIPGTLSGSTTISFFSRSNHLVVPRHLYGVSPTTTYWLNQFMAHHGYVFGARVLSTSTTYHAYRGFMRTWTGGQSYLSGNITGFARIHHH